MRLADIRIFDFLSASLHLRNEGIAHAREVFELIGSQHV